MAQISGAAVTLLLLLTVSLFCQGTASWGCCRRYSKHPISGNVILGYSIQTLNANCNINAILFHMNKGKIACADPSQPWVRDRIQKLTTKVWALKKQEQQQQRKRS